MALAPIDCKPNDRVAGKFVVKKKLGEGACGQVFLVTVIGQDGKEQSRAAMKVEPRMKLKDDEILKMEILVLKRMQKSKHVCRLLSHGHAPTFTYIVMSLLGPELADVRKRCPNRRIPHSSILRLTIQAVKALQDLHEGGFVHRDLKPSNLAMGAANPIVLYIFDFGLARQILVDSGRGGTKLRDERPRVMFRGTSRYCSINVHLFREQGRHDDLISVMHSMIECTAVLPWRGHLRRETSKIKERTTDQELCKDCPPSFLETMRLVKRLKYADVPPYIAIFSALKKDLPAKMKMTDPYEWTSKKGNWWEDYEKSLREKAELDKDATGHDQKTIQDVEESVVTEDEKSRGIDEGEFPQNDDTLDGM